MPKFEKIKTEEGEKFFYDYCITLFLRKKFEEHQINGVKEKRQALVLCFPHQKEKSIQKKFESLLKSRVHNAIVNEKDPYKIQLLPPHRNMGGLFWTEFYYSLSRETFKKLSTKADIKYVNINHFGMSYNDKDVIFYF